MAGPSRWERGESLQVVSSENERATDTLCWQLSRVDELPDAILRDAEQPGRRDRADQVPLLDHPARAR